MNIEVTKDNVVILENSDTPHENEYKITTCYFTFDEFTNSFEVKYAVFTVLSTGQSYQVDIINNQCDIPSEVLKHEYETIKLGVYGINVDDSGETDILEQRFSPSYTTFIVPTGSYEENAETPETITPSQYEIYSHELQEGLDDIAEAVENAERLDVDANKVGGTTTITITKQDGTQKSVSVEDGIDGIGLDYDWEGTSLGIKRENESSYEYVNLKGDKGDAGAIKFEIVEQLPTEDIQEDTIYLVPYAVLTVQELPSIGLAHTIYIVESTNKRYIYESNQWIEITSDNKYIEYIYVNNQWEELGEIGVDIDLSDYYTKTETNNLLDTKQALIDSTHKLSADLVDDTNTTNKFVTTSEKSAWNNKYDKPNGGIPSTDMTSEVQTSLGKADTSIQSADLVDYVKNTDYANNNIGGVIKSGDTYKISIDPGGSIRTQTVAYTTYQNMSNNAFIGKGTLENIITGKDLTTKTYVDGLVGDIATTLDIIQREVI